MSEQKWQTSISEKEEEREGDYASDQDMQIEVSNTKASMHQVNAIEPIVEGDNNNTITTITTTDNFHLITQEEEDLTIKVKNAGNALYDLVLSAIEKAKIITAQKVKDLA